MTAEIFPQIVYGAVLFFLLAAVGALWGRMGSIQKDVGRLEVTVAGTQTSLTEKTDTLQTSINEKTEVLQTSINEKTEVLQTSTNEKTEALQTSINEKTEALQTSINEKTAALQTAVDALMKTQQEMQLQMQRNHYQMMMAILSHSHRPDGRPTFDLPPDFEPNPSSGDPDD